jgi:hypothetical protein
MVLCLHTTFGNGGRHAAVLGLERTPRGFFSQEAIMRRAPSRLLYGSVVSAYADSAPSAHARLLGKRDRPEPADALQLVGNWSLVSGNGHTNSVLGLSIQSATSDDARLYPFGRVDWVRVEPKSQENVVAVANGLALFFVDETVDPTTNRSALRKTVAFVVDQVLHDPEGYSFGAVYNYEFDNAGLRLTYADPNDPRYGQSFLLAHVQP